MAQGGYSGRRFRRHFADVQGHILNGRFGASSSESRPSPVGHYLPPRHHKNLCVSDRSRSTADISRDPSEATKSSLLSFSLVGGLTSRGPWLKVCSHQGRAGAPDPRPTSALQRSRRSCSQIEMAWQVRARSNDLTGTRTETWVKCRTSAADG